MLLQTNSYIVPKEKKAEHARLLRRFRQTLAKLGCEHFEVYEQVSSNWTTDGGGRFVQIMRFRDRRHQQQIQAAERSDSAAQALIEEFCQLINFPYQQQQGLFAVGFYTSAIPTAPLRDAAGAPDESDGSAESVEGGPAAATAKPPVNIPPAAPRSAPTTPGGVVTRAAGTGMVSQLLAAEVAPEAIAQAEAENKQRAPMRIAPSDTFDDSEDDSEEFEGLDELDAAAAGEVGSDLEAPSLGTLDEIEGDEAESEHLSGTGETTLESILSEEDLAIETAADGASSTNAFGTAQSTEEPGDAEAIIHGEQPAEDHDARSHSAPNPELSSPPRPISEATVGDEQLAGLLELVNKTAADEQAAAASAGTPDDATDAAQGGAIDDDAAMELLNGPASPAIDSDALQLDVDDVLSDGAEAVSPPSAHPDAGASDSHSANGSPVMDEDAALDALSDSTAPDPGFGHILGAIHDEADHDGERPDWDKALEEASDKPSHK